MSGKRTGAVSYNVQVAVDTHRHLIVAHEVTNIGDDRSQLSTMGEAGTGGRRCELMAIADRVQ
jgi:hypothetical protein